ncbi:putative membrane protein mmpS1 [Mycobacteroides abscessus 3A-0122-S]|nr:putative membrane protein mmpS1 [Mycobacteroides abscessus 3A-0122-S]
MVMVLVLVIAGFAVWRIRGIFGSHQLPTYAGSMTDDKNNSKPKHVLYEIFGPPGTTADINYIDKEGEPHQINGATLPWSIEIITTAPSMTGNILAQTRNADGLGCRITANDEKKDERYTNEVSAYVYCFVKSA